MQKTRVVFTVFLLLMLFMGLAAGQPAPKHIDMKNAGHVIHAAEFTKENNGVKFDKDVVDATHFKVKKDKTVEAITVSLEDEKSETHKQSIGVPLADLPDFRELLEVKHYTEKGVNDYTTIVRPIIINDIAYIDVEFTSITISPFYSSIANWNFESWSSGTITPDNWVKWIDGGSRSTDAKLGSYSYKITGDGSITARGLIVQDVSGFTVGSNYTIGAWIKATGVTSGHLTVDLYNDSQDSSGATWTTNTDWRWIEFSEPINAANGQLRVFVDGAPNSGSEWYIDAVIMSRDYNWSASEYTADSTQLTQSITFWIPTLRVSSCYVTSFKTKTFNDFTGCTVSATIDGNGVSCWTAGNQVYVNTSGTSVGTHTVNVTVQDNSPLASSGSASQTSVDAGTSVQFTDTSTGTPETWSWDFGDGAISTSKNPSHIYTASGTHTVTLTTTKSSGWAATSTGTVTAITVAPLVANFSADRTKILAGDSIQFTDTSTCSPDAWLWNFGDGTASTLKNPSHTYATGGNYTVNLTATITAGAGVSSSKSMPNYITVTQSINAAFSATPTVAVVGEPIYFNDLSAGTGIDSWLWDFGDGNTSTEQFPEHSYGALGVYNISLTASSSARGVSDTETKLGYVTVQNIPMARFEVSPAEGNIPLSVSFRDTSTGATPTSWHWDFGDGGSSVTPNPSHTYDKIGTYTVSLTVSNAAGTSTSTKVNCIRTEVYDLATRVSFTTTTVKNSDIVTCADASVGNIASRTWDFGDGNTSTEQNPVYTYGTSGAYTVTLTVLDSAGNYTAQHTQVTIGSATKTNPPENYSQYSKKIFTQDMTLWDLPQNAAGVYTSYIPADLFYLIIILVMFIPLYIRTGSVLLPCILYLFIGGFIAVYIPIYFSTMLLWSMLFASAGLIYGLFIKD